MKKLIILSTVTTLLLLSVNSYAQNCKFHKDETDPFTKEHVRSSGPIRLSVTPIWWAQLEQKGTSYSLMLNISLIKQVRMSIAKGTKMLIKLEDGTVIEPRSTEEVVPTVNVEQQQYIVSQWAVHMELTASMMEKLSKSPIELIRTQIGTDECNMPKAHSKGANKIMDLAGCMIGKD